MAADALWRFYPPAELLILLSCAAACSGGAASDAATTQSRPTGPGSDPPLLVPWSRVGDIWLGEPQARKVIIRRAVPGDASGIARVCAEGWRDTYQDIYPPEEIETVIADYYTPERIAAEIIAPEESDGWIVAVESGKVIGAGGGGMTDQGVGEIFVLYLDPTRR